MTLLLTTVSGPQAFLKTTALDVRPRPDIKGRMIAAQIAGKSPSEG